MVLGTRRPPAHVNDAKLRAGPVAAAPQRADVAARDSEVARRKDQKRELQAAYRDKVNEADALGRALANVTPALPAAPNKPDAGLGVLAATVGPAILRNLVFGGGAGAPEMGGGAGAMYSARIKMGQTSPVNCYVKAGGKIYMTSQEIKVTVGGCGG